MVESWATPAGRGARGVPQNEGVTFQILEILFPRLPASQVQRVPVVMASSTQMKNAMTGTWFTVIAAPTIAVKQAAVMVWSIRASCVMTEMKTTLTTVRTLVKPPAAGMAFSTMAKKSAMTATFPTQMRV